MLNSAWNACRGWRGRAERAVKIQILPNASAQIAEAPAGADDEQALRSYSAISTIRWVREYAGSTTTTRATESRLGGLRQGCQNVSCLLHLIVFGHKAGNLSSATVNSPANSPQKTANLFLVPSVFLDRIPGPMHYQNSLLLGLAPSDERGECLHKGIAVYALSLHILRLLLLPCRHSGSRAASRESGTDSIRDAALADPHRLNLRKPGPRASVSWVFCWAIRPHCD